ncbi:MAG: hypothetical protein WCI63_00260 [bacterium]
MFELLVKIVGLNLEIGPTVYSPSQIALESGALHGMEAMLVTQALPKRRIRYKILIDTSKIDTNPNGADTALMSGEILNDTGQQVGHFDAKVQLFSGRWIGNAQLIYSDKPPAPSILRFLETI